MMHPHATVWKRNLKRIFLCEVAFCVHLFTERISFKLIFFNHFISIHQIFKHFVLVIVSHLSQHTVWKFSFGRLDKKRYKFQVFIPVHICLSFFSNIRNSTIAYHLIWNFEYTVCVADLNLWTRLNWLKIQLTSLTYSDCSSLVDFVTISRIRELVQASTKNVLKNEFKVKKRNDDELKMNISQKDLKEIEN